MAVHHAGNEKLTPGASGQTDTRWIQFFVFRVPAKLWNGKTDQGSLDERREQIENRGKSNILLTDKKEAHPEGDLPLAIPGGIIGAHAFFTILENILRNAAKYSYQKGKGNLCIVIEILDPQNAPSMRIRNPGSKTLIPATLVRIYDNVSHNVDIQKINEKLRKPLLDESTFDTRREAWGLAEIVIAAGFLQQRDILHIGSGGDGVTGDLRKPLVEINTGSDSSEPEIKEVQAEAIVRAVKSPICTLGYEFFMLQPLDLEVILPKGAGLNDLEKFFENFSQVFVAEDLSQALRRGDLFLWFVSGKLHESSDRFLRVLGGWLEEKANSIGERDWREIQKDLRSWFGEDENQEDTQETSRKWLSVVIERFPRRFFLALPEREYNDGPPWLNREEDPLIRRIVWMVYDWQKDQLVLKDAKHREVQFTLNFTVKNLEEFLRFLRARFVDRLLPPIQQGGKNVPLFEIDWHYALQDPEGSEAKRLNRYDVETLPPVLQDSAEARARLKNGNGAGDQGANRVIVDEKGEDITKEEEKKERTRDVSYPARLLVVCSRHDTVTASTVQYTLRLDHIKTKYAAVTDMGSGQKVKRHPYVIRNFVLTGAFPWFALIQHDPSSLSFRVAEAGAVRVGVMDERFQEWNRKEPIWMKNAVAGVFSVYLEGPGKHNQPERAPGLYWTLPRDHLAIKSSLSFDFHAENGTTPAEALSGLTDLPHIGEDLNVEVPFDILIVHMGLLETAFRDKGREFFEAWAYELKKKIPFVVFTSGRGEPAKLPEGVGFLPLASFTQTFHSVGVDKVSLIRTVLALI